MLFLNEPLSYSGPLICWHRLTELVEYLVDERVSHSLRILLVGDYHAGEVVAAHEHVCDVLLLFDRRARGHRRTLGNYFGSESHEFFDAAALKVAETG